MNVKIVKTSEPNLIYVIILSIFSSSSSNLLGSFILNESMVKDKDRIRDIYIKVIEITLSL